MGSFVDENGAKLDTPQTPKAKPKPRRLRQIMVVHRLAEAEKLFAACAKRFASEGEYVTKFFNNQGDAEAWIARQDEPYALFVAKLIPPPTVSDKERDE